MRSSSSWGDIVVNVTALIAITVAGPSLLSLWLLATPLDWTYQVLLALVALAAVHPVLGLPNATALVSRANLWSLPLLPSAAARRSDSSPKSRYNSGHGHEGDHSQQIGYSKGQRQSLSSTHLTQYSTTHSKLPAGFVASQMASTDSSSAVSAQTLRHGANKATDSSHTAQEPAQGAALRQQDGLLPSASDQKPTPSEHDPYIGELEGLSAKFVQLCNLDTQPVGTGSAYLWQPVVNQTNGNFSVQVHQRTDQSMFFRVVVDLESTPEEAFDLLADISIRPTWDDMCDSSDVLYRFSGVTNIQYMRTKGIWPTAPRCALLVAFVKRLEDGRYLNATHSIDSHPSYEPESGDVRMTAHLAGVLIGPHPTIPNMTRCFQLINGDLGGWLPQSVVSMVTTQAFPISMRKVNSILSSVASPRTVSELIRQAELSSTHSNTKGGRAAVPHKAALGVSAALESGAGDSKHTVTSASVPFSSAVAEKKKPKAVATSSRRSLMGIIKFIFRILEKGQPLMVLALFIAYFTQKRG
ncbi:hypothetical protein BASA50_006675 [Batrachochytrium salamandrivorans]|uniref:START domain-containing protein n=1 Tax=Batrachochytrium salamandrivorans TaxID=1357716 RepID=A0ABQ8FAL5_9FUNG|nr:hypothetical protein BASA50_006675 [Batrachochytrium salamandrivorans]